MAAPRPLSIDPGTPSRPEGRATQPTAGMRLPVAFDGRNILTIDVEDYFHASGLGCAPDDWASMPGRVEYATRRLLRMLAEHDAQATFFVLGWVAENYPALVREIHAAGHEIASHGHAHRLVYEQDSSAFREDVHRARTLLEQLIGAPVVGYRAPSFSLPNRNPWALEILVETGHRYDSSIFPVLRARYGDPFARRDIHRLEVAGGSLLEVPPSTIRVAGGNLPVAGGGYLRLLPSSWTRRAIRSLNRRESMPAVVYVHPWEIDPDQPRMAAATRVDRFRHYLNLDRTEGRLRDLLRTFRFAPVRAVTGLEPALSSRASMGGAA